MNDVKLFSRRFREDTDLDIEFRLKTCNDCGRLHCIIVVDEVPENEKERDEE